MDNRMEWKLKRIQKKIPLSGELAKYVSVSYNMISMHENGHCTMSEDKVSRYKSYIAQYPITEKGISK